MSDSIHLPKYTNIASICPRVLISLLQLVAENMEGKVMYKPAGPFCHNKLLGVGKIANLNKVQ